jgi:hypothetical protein
MQDFNRHDFFTEIKKWLHILKSLVQVTVSMKNNTLLNCVVLGIDDFHYRSLSLFLSDDEFASSFSNKLYTCNDPYTTLSSFIFAISIQTSLHLEYFSFQTPPVHLLPPLMQGSLIGLHFSLQYHLYCLDWVGINNYRVHLKMV